MHEILVQWRFSFDDEQTSLRNLSWSQAVQVFRDTTAGELTAQSDGNCVSVEFNANHAAVLYMGRDGVILRPYFPLRSAGTQDLAPFFCGGCGVRVGDRQEYLTRFLLTRADGFRLFTAVLVDAALPTKLPEAEPRQPLLPGLEEMAGTAAIERMLVWQPLPSNEAK